MPTIKYKDKTYGASRMGYHNTDAVSDVADDDELPVFDKSANAYKKTLFSSLKSKFWTYVQSQLASVATSGDYDDLTNAPSKQVLTPLANVDETTEIPDGSDLNSIDFMKIGTYVVTHTNSIATLTNCPTTQAFMMFVSTSISSEIDDETTSPWVYRVRRIVDIYGDEYVQSANTNGTVGVFTYNAWKKTIHSNNLATVATSGDYNDLSNKPSLNYLPLSGGKMTGALKFANGGMTENRNPAVMLGMDTFANGGEVHWLNASNTADAIGALKTSGGTVSGKIERSGGGSWIKSRDNVAVMGSSYGQASGNSFNVSVGQKTTSGAWVMGNLSGGEGLDFAYTSDANYSTQQNSYKRVRLPLPTGTDVNLITSENMANYVQKTESRFQGEIASGNSIFNVLKSTTCPWGLSFWYTQHADDAPRKGSVSFTIINKPTSGGTYSHIYFFSDTHLYIALTGSALPSALSFTQIF